VVLVVILIAAAPPIPVMLLTFFRQMLIVNMRLTVAVLSIIGVLHSTRLRCDTARKCTAATLQRAKEKYPEAKPRIISDNGPQFIARDFKDFIRISGMTHVRTSPYYPQSNGKIERWHKSLKSECIRLGTPLSLEDARRLVEDYVEHYNNVRLNSATGYTTPKDVLVGRQQEIHAERDRKLEVARQQRQSHRQQAA
jgi:Integrase core domain